MPDALLAALGVIGAAGIGGLFSWFVSRNREKTERVKTSGDIHTSDAAALWQESNAMRQELRGEVSNLRASHQDCERRVEELREDCERRVEELRAEVAHVRSKLREV